MIKCIDTKQFGSFRNFIWNKSVCGVDGNIATFKKLNILYGRNYSGKTTLSRIIRSIETGKLPNKYDAPSFSLTTSSGTLTEKQIPSTEFTIRVYNKDFIDDNLSFLRDDNGHIEPFAIIGSDNKAIERQITALEGTLGSVDGGTGLCHKYATKKIDLEKLQKQVSTDRNRLDQKLFQKANQAPAGIKHNPLYRDVNYDIRKLKADIENIRSRLIPVLTEKEKHTRETLIAEKSLPDIKTSIQFDPAILTLHEVAQDLLSRKITPSKPIQELLDDALLQLWVKNGITYHRGKRTKCGFCGQPLPDHLWDRLDQHFSKESSELELTIANHITAVKQERTAIANVINVSTGAFYASHHTAFDEQRHSLEDILHKYVESLDDIIVSLGRRANDIFRSYPVPELTVNTSEIAARIKEINELIVANNRKTELLDRDQLAARNELRLSEVAQFIKDINLFGEEKRITALQLEADLVEAEVEALGDELKLVESQIDQLRAQLTDERKGAAKVNEYLNHYFGHGQLQLNAVEEVDATGMRFQICRGDSPAYNLSEGECSLVAFCYFLAKLEDAESQGKRLIIYIDDPVSSLDSNHMFFLYSLIESVLAKALSDNDGNVVLDANGKPIYRYEQMFISTHNLEFLKYLKRISRPKNDCEEFMVIQNESGSIVQLMPSYLKLYITEFNFLFEQIYICSDPSNAASVPHCFYDFGNNLRRFLEAFLFYKFPFALSDGQDYNRRIKRFFANSPSTETLVQRVTNEFSHLGGVFDRGTQPIDNAETSRLAKFVLMKMKENDRDQFDCLLESIGKPDPLVDTANLTVAAGQRSRAAGKANS